MNYYLLIIPTAILYLFAWLIGKNIDNFENEVKVDGHNGFVGNEFYDDNLD